MKKTGFTLICIVFLYTLHAQALYGTTSEGGGGTNSKGAITKLIPGTNTLTTAFAFDDPNPDGRSPLFSTMVQAADGKLYGMTYEGGNSNLGTIFSFNPANAAYTKLFDFNGTNGAYASGSLIQAPNGKLYGMTSSGGSFNFGTLFSFDPTTTAYIKLLDFDSTNGATPYGSLMQATNGKLYGMTATGGSGNFGVLFSFTPSTNSYAKIREFDSTRGAYPHGDLIQAANGKLYGMTNSGGSSNRGVIFSFNISTAAYTKLMDFTSAKGVNPYGTLMQATDGKLYGTTSAGGNYRDGVIFSFNLSGNIYTKLKDLEDSSGYAPRGNLVQAADGKLYGTTIDGGSYNHGAIYSVNPSNGAYTRLMSFDGNDGGDPRGSLTIASNGKMYGLAHNGGGPNYGVIFSFVPSSATYNKLKVFGTCTNGCNITGGVVKNAAGKLYGMFSNGGGVDGLGGLYSFDPVSGAYAKLFDFNGANGANPYGSLTLAANGKLYGMTHDGGSNGLGVIFSFDLATSTYTKLKDFDSTNGYNPQGNLVQASNGKLYGMTNFGGDYDAGVIFSVDPATSVYTRLKDFDDANGATPYGSLIQGSDGKLYGMTTFGGLIGAGVIFSFNPSNAVYAKLMNFVGSSGAYPYGSLIQATDGKLYGMTYSGGSSGVGVLFSFNPTTAAYAKLKDFDIANGRSPRGSLVQASDGKLYGMTSFGGSNDYGVAFSYTPATATYTKLKDFNEANGKYPVYSYFTEVAPAVKIKISNVAQPEGNSGTTAITFSVTLSQTSTQTVTVDYQTQNGTAKAGSDYVAQSGTISFAPGVKKKTISVNVIGDTQVEPEERFKVVLSDAVNATIGDNTGLGTIQNDDGTTPRMMTQDNDTLLSVKVSPSPATNIINVALSGYNGSTVLQLADMQGKILKTAKLQLATTHNMLQPMNVADIASGTYLLLVLDEKGNKQTRRVVIIH